MQFSCESCKTQLQIADEKVRGKRLIVRCKRCGAKIGISDPALGAPRPSRPAPAAPQPSPAAAPAPARARAAPAAARPSSAAAAGEQRDSDTESTRAMDSDLLEQALQASKADEPSSATDGVSAPADAPPPPSASSDAAEWFAMLHGKQAGPMTRKELAARTDEGAVGPRTYLWKDGMDAWHRAKDLPELQHLFPRLPEAPLPPPPVAPPAPQALREFSTPDFVAPAAAAKSEPATVEKPPASVARPAAEKPQVDAAAGEARTAAAKDEHRINADPLPFGDLVEQESVAKDLFASDSDSQKTPPDLVNWAAAELQKKSAPPRPAVSAARMFESAAPPRGRSPFLFAVVGLLALAALVMWLEFGGGSAAAPPPPETAQKKAAPPAPATPVTTVPAKSDSTPAPQPPPGKPAAETTGLTADQVRKKLDENKAALQTCIDEALRRDPNLRVGKIHIATTIAPTGQVTQAKIDKGTVDQSPLGACLRRATRRIAFPTFSGDAFDVDIPIVVTAGE